MKNYFPLFNLKTVLLIIVFSQLTISCQKGCKEKECTGMVFAVIDPVCGCNGVTYGNPSEARCHGIENYTKGACEDN